MSLKNVRVQTPRQQSVGVVFFKTQTEIETGAYSDGGGSIPCPCSRHVNCPSVLGQVPEPQFAPSCYKW